MRILIVKPILPYPPTQGTRRVTMALIRALAAEHELDLLVPLQSREQQADVLALERETGCRVTSMPALSAPGAAAGRQRIVEAGIRRRGFPRRGTSCGICWQKRVFVHARMRLKRVS